MINEPKFSNDVSASARPQHRSQYPKISVAKYLGLLIVVVCASSSAPFARACNIPVFRYALERWQSDNCQLVVFHQAALTDAQEKLLAKLASKNSAGSPTANLEIVRSVIGQETKSELKSLWISLSDQAKVNPASVGVPYAVVRVRMTGQRQVNVWHGKLEDLSTMGLLESPARKKLVDRLMAGDSVVWLMLKSADEKRNETVRSLMTAQFAKLAKQMKLPEGIGLPGSELFAEVPLLLQFSMIEIDPQDKREAWLIKLMSSIDPDAVAKGEPMLAPVFGRGRALEVLPGSMINDGLVEDLTLFMCGACSCQVKERNPGFDLLISADWESLLFGESGQSPASAEPAARDSDQTETPVLLTIPPGRKK